MRNLKSFTHLQPLTQNSFQKSQRPIIQNIPIQNLNRKKYVSQYEMLNEIEQPIMQTTGVFQVGKYSFQLAQSFPIIDRNSNIVNIDPTCIWFSNIQKSPTKSKRFITFQKLKYTIKNQVNQYTPSTFYICLDGFQGYHDKNGNFTDRLVCLYLQQIGVTINQQNLRTYDLVYQSKQSIKWEIPNQMTNLKMRIKVQDNPDPVDLPLQCPITVRFTIEQQRYR